jgi:hypothetical protein
MNAGASVRARAAKPRTRPYVFETIPLRNVFLSEEDRPLANDPDESKDRYTLCSVSIPGFFWRLAA